MIEGIDLEEEEEVCNGEIVEPDKTAEHEHSDVRFHSIVNF